MAVSTKTVAGAGSARLRGDIDSGRTGDKVGWPDPAAVPLGTDEEAAGTPLQAQAAESARAYERSRPQGDPHARRTGIGLAWWLGVFAVTTGTIVGATLLGR